MHILFLTDNFPPEGNAPATRTFEHAREWVKNGIKVTVITCAPNFPAGKLFDGYSNDWLKKDYREGITVWRVKSYIAPNEGFYRRSIDYFSFMLSAFFFGLFVRKVDVVIGTSPQFFTVIGAWALAKCKHVPFVFELRDIWPEAIGALNAIKNRSMLAFFERIELFLYRQASLIIAVTNSFKSQLEKRGISASKIRVVQNGVDLSVYKPKGQKDIDYSIKYDLYDKFVAGYIGTHGLAHSLDTIIEAAELLSDDDFIRLIFAGDGADRLRLEQRVKDLCLSNVIMMGQQSKEKMPQVWSLCNVSIVCLKDIPIYSSVIPSKIFESMAMRLPIIISVPEGEATKIITDEGVGLVVPADNPRKLASAIRQLAYDTKLFDDLVVSSSVSSKKFDRKIAASRMLKFISEVVT